MIEEPPYTKLYTHKLHLLAELSVLSTAVLLELLKYLVHETQEVVLNAAAKQRIATACRVATGAVANELHQLAQQGLISKVSTDTYTLNPELFGADPRTRRANEA